MNYGETINIIKYKRLGNAVQTCTDPSTACVCVSACVYWSLLRVPFQTCSASQVCAPLPLQFLKIYSIERNAVQIETIFILLPAIECFTKVHTISPIQWKIPSSDSIGTFYSRIDLTSFSASITLVVRWTIS